MFELALKAGFPVIGVRTDDVLNFPEALKLISKKKPVAFNGTNNLDDPDTILWVEDTGAEATKHLTYAYVANLKKKQKQLVLVNPKDHGPIVFNGGTLTVPKALITGYLRDVLGTKFVDSIYMALKGLSLRAVNEVVLLTQARTGAHTIKELRRTRSMLSGGVQGLTPMDTDYDFYLFPEKLETWLKLNKPYFLSPKTPTKLRPRGLLLDGSAGVGKSMAAKAIAKTWDLPLYRVDVAASLSRWVGESEARIGQSLQLVEKESPCILLLDEVEKIFGASGSDDAGVTTRILSQLLWWLAEHQGQVLTIMTTNNMSKLPPELYRSGRVDLCMKIPRLTPTEAMSFARKVFINIMDSDANLVQQAAINTMFKLLGKDDYAHAEVSDLVADEIKKNGWFSLT